jgi:hypothetical protein
VISREGVESCPWSYWHWGRCDLERGS